MNTFFNRATDANVIIILSVIIILLSAFLIFECN